MFSKRNVLQNVLQQLYKVWKYLKKFENTLDYFLINWNKNGSRLE